MAAAGSRSGLKGDGDSSLVFDAAPALQRLFDARLIPRQHRLNGIDQEVLFDFLRLERVIVKGAHVGDFSLAIEQKEMRRRRGTVTPAALLRLIIQVRKRESFFRGTGFHLL